jgi:hypothetical protein
MHGLPYFMLYEIGDVYNVVDASLANGLQAFL